MVVVYVIESGYDEEKCILSHKLLMKPRLLTTKFSILVIFLVYNSMPHSHINFVRYFRILINKLYNF